MLFTTIDFAVFLPIVFALYWFVPWRSVKQQNCLIVLSSCVFYGWWNWQFLGLIGISVVCDFFIGGALGRETSVVKRKVLVWTSLAINLGLLAFFKYFNFFTSSFADAFTLLGQDFDGLTLNIILPVGISFYTFQTLSYTIDIYRSRIQPTRDFIAFAAFVSFFPQLVAGPIERARRLLPQFLQKRTFNRASATDGMRQILWGLFKKVVIADTCAIYVDDIFLNYTEYSNLTLVLGAVLFAFQIYGDFSGYSDIAIGTARLFGFDLMKNFAFPYFSRDIAEFWRRWHISLSTWFRDYLYIPLGGSRVSKGRIVRNVFIVFAVSGLWHGANWTFVFWGLLHALFFLPLILTENNRHHLVSIPVNRWLPTPGDMIRIVVTFTLTTVAWVFFRAPTISQAFDYLGQIFDPANMSSPSSIPLGLIAMIGVLMIVEWLQREKEHGLALSGRQWPRALRWSAYFVLAILVNAFVGRGTEFIYFQF